MKLKHALSAITLGALEHPDRARVVDALVAYARSDAGRHRVSLDVLAHATGMKRDEVGRVLSATGLFEIPGADHGSVSLSASFRPFVAYLCRQSGRSATALRLLRSPHEDMPEEIWRAAALFDAGLFFECHEYLEDVWRAAPGPERAFYHGLVQAAAGCYHLEKANMHGARTLIEKAIEKLAPFAPAHRGVDVATFLAGLRRLLLWTAGGSAGSDPAQGSASPPWNPGLLPRVWTSP